MTLPKDGECSEPITKEGAAASNSAVSGEFYEISERSKQPDSGKVIQLQ